ncbi:MAG: DegT/DnrJ/EryC1/StrS family aminotransferase [Dethiobacter sp.]|nr:DegT/DnrJ/EryC1/StrS family aminotransferase [Dethiobacter sp.]MCL5982081.1 DegT/DnrJ/EryC1/StrS family aminotransferase [Bacillota bacterium]
MVYYPLPLHRLPPYADVDVSCPTAETLATEVLSQPLWPELAPALHEQVAEALRQALVIV